VYRPHHVDIPIARPSWIETLFFLLLILLVAFILLKSPLFEVRSLEIRGNSQLSREEIEELSGIKLGDNIFKLDFEKAGAKIKKSPLVKNVTIKRFLPAKVVIEVEERHPAALLAIENGLVVVDAEGFYLREGFFKEELPVITGVEAELPLPGRRINDKKLDTALFVVTRLTPEVLHRLSEIHVDKQQRVYIYTSDGIQGRLGKPSDVAFRGEMFIQVIDSLGQKARDIKYIDLSYTGWPVICFKESGGNNGGK